MNFYSLDGSKIDSNNLFENKTNYVYERFDNLQSQNQNISTSLDNDIDEDDNNEEFASVPTTKSNATDSSYQCSDGYTVKGANLGKQFKNSTLANCKEMCANAGNDCIGFNFNTKNNVCDLKKNATSLMNSNPSSTLCIKKSAGNANCKVNNNKQKESPKGFNELDSIFNEQSNSQQTIPGSTQDSLNPTNPSNPNYPMEVPTTETPNDTNDMDMVEQTPESENQNLGTNSNNSNMEANMGNNPSGVYVDLECFMKNINVLQNRSDNMMIDLSLLLSNIKTCSYVKKTSSNPNSKLPKDKMNTSQLINQITSKINIPEPDTVQLKNVKADVLVTDGTSSSGSQVLEMAREPFSTDEKNTNSKSYNWSYQDMLLVIILIVLICLLIFRK